MAEFILKYADARGKVHQVSAVARNEGELRERYARDGFLVYSVSAKGEAENPLVPVARVSTWRNS